MSFVTGERKHTWRALVLLAKQEWQEQKMEINVNEAVANNQMTSTRASFLNANVLRWRTAVGERIMLWDVSRDRKQLVLDVIYPVYCIIPWKHILSCWGVGEKMRVPLVTAKYHWIQIRGFFLNFQHGVWNNTAKTSSFSISGEKWLNQTGR